MNIRVMVVIVSMTVASLVAGPIAGTRVTAASQPAYALGPGDTIEILVLGDAELSRAVTVKPDGTIALPLLGEVMAADKTTSQLADELVARYSRYLKAPSITVTVREFRVERVYVMGQITRPGEYPVRPGLTVADLLSAAGGVTSRAGLKRAFLVRGNEQIPVDVQKILAGDLEANLPLRAGDTLVVPESQDRIAVLGAIHKPGTYDLVDGMRLIDAIAAAGGQSETANIDQVVIVRLGGGKTQTVQANLRSALTGEDARQNVLLQNGDVIYIQDRGTTLAQTAQVLTVLNLVRVLLGGTATISF